MPSLSAPAPTASPPPSSSPVHPLAAASPFFRELPLADFGLEWIQPPIPLAHPLDDGSAAVLERSLDVTAAGLGSDTQAYRDLFAPITRNWERLLTDFLAPPRLPSHQIG